MLNTKYTNPKGIIKYLTGFSYYLILIFISINQCVLAIGNGKSISISTFLNNHIVTGNLARNIGEGKIPSQNIIFIFSHEFLVLIFIFLSFIVVISLIRLKKWKPLIIIEKSQTPISDKSNVQDEIKQDLERIKLERENFELRRKIASEKDSFDNNFIKQFKKYFISAEKRAQQVEEHATQVEFEKNQLENENIQLRSKIAYNLLSSHTLKNSVHSGLFNYFILTNKSRKKRLDFINRQTIFYEELHAYSTKDYINLIDEIDFVNLYCSLFEKHNINLEVKNNLENPKEVKIPSLITIAIVENSINKGFRRPKNIENKIVYEINPIQSGFEIIIADNGIGKTAYEEQKANFKEYIKEPIDSGTGISGLVERLNAINLKSEGKEFIKLQSFSNEDQPNQTLGFDTGFTTKLILYNHEHINS